MDTEKNGGRVDAAMPNETTSGSDVVYRRPGLGLACGVLAVALFLALVFEMAKHLGLTVPFALLGLVLPDLPRLLSRRVRSGVRGLSRSQGWLHQPWWPLIVMILFSLSGGTWLESTAGFNFGLAWLTHIAGHRALQASRR